MKRMKGICSCVLALPGGFFRFIRHCVPLQTTGHQHARVPPAGTASASSDGPLVIGLRVRGRQQRPTVTADRLAIFLPQLRMRAD